MKNKSLTIAVVTSFMIIAMAFIINFTTSWHYPWFVYPTFALLWWPVSVFFAQKKMYKLYSVVGSLLIIGMAFFINITTSPNFLWFIFPAFAVLWWPLSMYLGRKPKLFSVVSSIYLIAFFLLLNYITSWNFKWFIFPAFAVLWWPISMIICGAKKYKLYAVVSVLYIVSFLALVNYMVSPQYTWFYYAIFPLLWWPMSMFFGRKGKVYSVVMALLTIGYMMLINYMNTPGLLWYPYCIMPFLIWPAAMLLGKKAKSIWFAIIGSIVIIAYYIFLYYLLTPEAHPWYWYIVLPVLWWPVSMFFGKKSISLGFQLISAAIFIAYYVSLNLILTPERFWSLNVIYPLLWAAMGVYFGHNKKFFAFSVCAALVTIVYFSILNYMVSPNVIWAVYPSFAILWWPLSMYFFGRKRKKPLTATE